ncbi:MAG: hypothetical protein HXO13_06660 [Prevotella salivae]|jgi:hypothetical protein|nr:hypothetical protein [Segatella salivae]DAE73957.1 MAG TPA: hypothetical protein [Caudoviricetes sp.]
MSTEKRKVGRPAGQPKYGGRKKGTPNKTTQITRKVINDIAEGMQSQVMKDLAQLEPADRVKVFIKLCEFLVSKPQTVSLDMTTERKITIEDKLLKLSNP